MATVLVMDDDQIVRTLIVRILKLRGHTAIEFPDAGPALRTVDFDTIDLIITDLSMPTPGEEAIRVLRQRGIQVPILVISGQLQHEKASYLLCLGAQATLEKPFQVQNLLDLVDTWI